MPTADRPGAVLSGDTIAIARGKMRRLIEHGFKARQRREDGGLDARLLLAHQLQLSRTDLIAAADRAVTAGQATALTALAVEAGRRGSGGAAGRRGGILEPEVLSVGRDAGAAPGQ